MDRIFKVFSHILNMVGTETDCVVVLPELTKPEYARPFREKVRGRHVGVFGFYIVDGNIAGKMYLGEWRGARLIPPGKRNMFERVEVRMEEGLLMDAYEVRGAGSARFVGPSMVYTGKKTFLDMATGIMGMNNAKRSLRLRTVPRRQEDKFFRKIEASTFPYE